MEALATIERLQVDVMPHNHFDQPFPALIRIYTRFSTAIMAVARLDALHTHGLLAPDLKLQRLYCVPPFQVKLQQQLAHL